LFFIIALLFFLLPPYPAKDQAGCNDGRIDINIIQLNDVYEIAPLDEGKIGGMARVATLKKEYLQKNVNTVMVMAGDFLSPSVFNNVRYNGSRVMGLQMVEAMNVAGFDLVAFGNHEFDLNKNSLQKCIDAGSFEWIASNTFEICCSGKGSFNQRARPLPRFLIKTFTDDDGTIGKVGFIGLTIETNTNDYVKYDSANATAKLLYDQISNYCDAVVAITHQSMDADIRLAKRVPGLTAIIGGHEHDGRDTVVNNVRITKADANAKNAFVLTLKINKNSTKPVRLTVEERKLDSTVLQDKYTAEIVNKWMKIATDSFKALGFDLKDIVFTSGRQLDGRDEKVRYDTTNLTNAIVAAMMKAYTEAQGAIFNAGSIRLDDYLMIPVTQYEILRALPYIDSIKLVQIKGSILKKILDAGRNLPSGDGMFLHYSTTISCSTLTNSWLLNNSEIKNDDNYTIAIAGYILSGKEPAFSFLKTETIESKSAGKPIDMNHALIDYLKANGETVAHTSNKKQ
jgi:2',3'-cyclic-nucleotide 2'-phosphodiesterase (5'-nucleotidase family)